LGPGTAEIVAPGEGTLSNIGVEVGDPVKKGQLVAHVSQPGLRDQIDALKRRLAQLLPTSENDPIAQIRNERRAQTEKELEQLEKKFEKNSKTVSPFDGRVIAVRATAGDHIDPGSSIVAIEREGERTQLEAVLYVDSYQGKLLKSGMTVELAPSTARK